LCTLRCKEHDFNWWLVIVSLVNIVRDNDKNIASTILQPQGMECSIPKGCKWVYKCILLHTMSWYSLSQAIMKCGFWRLLIILLSLIHKDVNTSYTMVHLLSFIFFLFNFDLHFYEYYLFINNQFNVLLFYYFIFTR